MYAMTNRELADASRALAKHTTPWRADPRRGEGGMRFEGKAALDLAVIDSSLFGWGLVAGRYGPPAVAGVSVDLVVGLACGALGAFNVGGDLIGPVMLDIGIASLGSFAMRKGVQVGTQMRTSAGLAPLGAADLAHGIFAGEFARNAITSGSARDLTEAELAAMSAATRRAA